MNSLEMCVTEKGGSSHWWFPWWSYSLFFRFVLASRHFSLANAISTLLGYWGSFETYVDKVFVLKIAIFSEGFYNVLLGVFVAVMIVMLLVGIISYAAIMVNSLPR